MKKQYLPYSLVFIILNIYSQFYSQNPQFSERKIQMTQSEIDNLSKGKIKNNKTEKAVGDIIWSEDFSNGISSWTKYGSNSSVWIYDLSGPGGQYTDPSISSSDHGGNTNTSSYIISSPTVGNGFADFIADEYCTTNGYSDLNGYLESPVIDLTGITGAELSFYQSLRVCCSGVNKLKVEISTNNFVTYQEVNVMEWGCSVLSVNSYLGTVNFGINLSDFLDTTSNKSNFKFRFNWNGQSSYFWQIDDIVIKERSIEGAGVVSITNGTICEGLTTTVSSTKQGGLWSSSNNTIASVDVNSGLVTGLTNGSSVLTYTMPLTGEKSSVCVQVIGIPNAGNASITDASICVGTTTTAISSSSGGTWSSSDINIATVSANAGLVTGVSSGTATLTYTTTGTGVCSGQTNTSTIDITINGIADAGTTSITDASICIGTTTTASSTIIGGVWSSSDNSIVTVDANTGLVTGIGSGTATLTYTVIDSGICGGATATSTLGVNVEDSGLDTGVLNIDDLSICEGNTTYVSSSQSGGTWSSSDVSVATVDPVSGLVTGIGLGNTNLNYTVNGSGLCSGSNTSSSIGISVSIPNSSSITFPINQMISNENGNYTLNASPSGGTYSGIGVTGSTFDPSSSGLGTVEIQYDYIDNSGCLNSKTVSTIVYDTTGMVCTSYDSVTVMDTLIINISLTGLNAPNNVNTMKVYPNPSNDIVNIDNGNYALMNGYSIKIINANAQEVYNAQINSQLLQVSVSQIGTTGNYFINVYDNNQNLVDSKVLVLQ